MQLENVIKSQQFMLVKQWMISIQTPVQTVDNLLCAIQNNIELKQGNYSNCSYVRHRGETRFKNEDGAFEGAEDDIRVVDSAEIIITLENNVDLLSSALETIIYHHVHEEPTITVTETWGILSGDKDDSKNPNRYWNREDGEAIHGAIAKK